ncbi:hypothetical protein PQX77_006068 [Marasmius sp. AFHP31]|nr:hypothetical protein PQX77_006068 [Marasmius sp. AFHP31]
MQRITLYTIFISFVFVLLLLRRRRRRPYPPGPKGWPIIGDLKALEPKTKDSPPGTKYRWERYVDWSCQYNSPDIVSIPVFGERMIILNTKKAVDDLLDKRSAKYSDRPAMRMANELSGIVSGYLLTSLYSELVGHGTLDVMIFFDPSHPVSNLTFFFSDSHTTLRLVEHFQPRAMPQYYDIQRAATDALIQKLTTNPENFCEHIRQYFGSMVLKITYGYELQINVATDPYVELANKAMQGLSKTSIPGTFLVDFFPVLKHMPEWLPGGGFKRRARMWKKESYELRDRPWEWFKTALAKGTADPSFATRSLEKLASSATVTSDRDREMMEEVIKNSAGVAYLAGTDTTVSFILSFILNMINNPDVQTRAQAEIDSLVASSGRLPDFGDQDKLPYTDAVIAETLRLQPVTPYAVPHAVEEDDVYEGYWIPKGSTVIGNVWAVLHDEDVYGAEPMQFNPDRFMPKEGDHSIIPPHPEKYAFGFGRRICPGRYLALNNAWLATARILADFTIVAAEGKEAPVVEYNDGLVRQVDRP